MSRSYLNLARDPFVNSRPVVRLSIALWVVAIALLAGNVWLYWDFLAGREDTYARLEEVDREIAATRQRIAALDAELEGFDLGEQNRQVEFLNERIDRRLFSWSELFDQLGAILPNDVYLTRLTPASGEGTSRRRGTGRDKALGEGRVLLSIDAVARDDASILATIDALFDDPAFGEPNLLQQTQEEGGLIRFELETVYQPMSRRIEITQEPESPDAEPTEPTEPTAEARSADGQPREPSTSNQPDTSAGPVRRGVPASSAPEVR